MGKKYLIVEEENDATGLAGCIILAGAFFAVIYLILTNSHWILGGGLGFCGFLLARYIVDSNPIYRRRQIISIYAACMLILGGTGYWAGVEVRNNFLQSLEDAETDSELVEDTETELTEEEQSSKGELSIPASPEISQ